MNVDNFISVEQDFRNTLSTADKEGKRIWIYPKKPSGKYTGYRELVAFIFLILLFSGPFIKISGEPLLLLNVIDRKFIIFGQIFWPQDFHILLLGMITFIIFIIVFTMTYGRLFCGWVCPQTIFMEMVFRKIEYWIEGDRSAQKLLDNQALDFKKIIKKSSKHLLFLGISFIISNTFLAYIIGIEELKKIVTDNPQNHLSGLLSITGFTFLFYFVFSRFREQVCTAVCPYGRLQGVLMDKNSIVVIYDYLRGERRSKLKKNEDRNLNKKGDCIDCHQCVDVCPTGIDIRNGTQLECINCTACIDACNFVMNKTGFPQGLIRYDSEAGISERKKFRFTGRRAFYSIILVLLIAVISLLLLTRSDVETTLVRASGTFYQKDTRGYITNLYTYKVVNKKNADIPLNFKMISPEGDVKIIGKKIVLPKHSIASGTVIISISPDQLSGLKTTTQIGVYDNSGKLIETISTKFLGPDKNL